jgi:hypothetical protein
MLCIFKHGIAMRIFITLYRLCLYIKNLKQNQVAWALVVNSGATALEYGSAGGAQAGQVIQVVSTTITTQQSTTSNSYSDVTGLSLSITPASASNKILIIFSGGAVGSNSSNYDAKFTIVRGSTNLGSASNGFGFIRGTGNNFYFASANYLDSPSTTSATTYKIQFLTDAGATAYIGYNNAHSTLTALEIKG